MAVGATYPEQAGSDRTDPAALQHRTWRRQLRLSSAAQAVERFLSAAGFDRAPWLAVAFAGGIGAWFELDNARQWIAMVSFCLGISLAALAIMRGDGRFPYLRQACVSLPLLVAAGCLVIWSKSELVGAQPIARPIVGQFSALVLSREDRPAEARIRLVLAIREPETHRPLRVRVNLPEKLDASGIVPGAGIHLKARLMPPAVPALPGGYNFARTAWFAGLAATGSVLGPIEITHPVKHEDFLKHARASLSRHVLTKLDGSAGGIAAALASGDRGAIAKDDVQAMRDAGLAHLLSISGLHVSALIAVAYLLALRLLALWPWLALRVRLPLLAAGAGAVAGIGYTLLTGSEVPTVRSCIGAVLVLAALALGREPLSLRLLAVAAFAVLLLWPEAVVGPSFQMSFAAIMAIVALGSSKPVKSLFAPRKEGLAARGARHIAMLLLTGFVVEAALMPISLYHFHRAGIYGAFANVIAIPMTTLLTMPLICIALLLDLIGAGGPVWWLAGTTIKAMLSMAHWVSARPGAVTMLPALGQGSIALIAAGGVWLALWRGKVRLLGLIPAIIGTALLAGLHSPDILITGDGRHIAITGEREGELLILRRSRSEVVRDNLAEIAGIDGEQRLLANWPGARCSRDFCAVVLHRAGRDWRLLLSLSHDNVPERALAAACDHADIVISDRWLPRSCKPVWIKADRRLLSQTGGLSIELGGGRIRSVAEDQGDHGWWPPAQSKRR